MKQDKIIIKSKVHGTEMQEIINSKKDYDWFFENASSLFFSGIYEVIFNGKRTKWMDYVLDEFIRRNTNSYEFESVRIILHEN